MARGPIKAHARPRRPAKIGRSKTKGKIKDAAKSDSVRKSPKKALSGDDIREIFRRFHAIEPEPKGELEHVNA